MNFLRGVNCPSYGYTPGEQMPRPEAVDYYASKGMNVFRLALGWEVIQPTLGGPLLASPWIVNVLAQADTAAEVGASLIVDVHNYMRRKVNGVDVIVGETAVVTSAHLCDLWSKLATALKGKSNVIFGLMNEPHDQVDATLVRVTNNAIAAIRATGATQMILVNGNDWGSYAWQAGKTNLKTMLRVRDPLNNIAFDIHHYFDQWGAGQKPDVVPQSTWLPGIASATAWARNNGRKLFCGEFAFPGTPAGLVAGFAFLSFLEANKDVWIGWCHLGGGGWWPYAYAFRLDPYGSMWDAGNPDRDIAIGGTGKASTWAAPLVDQPAMAVLDSCIGLNT